MNRTSHRALCATVSALGLMAAAGAAMAQTAPAPQDESQASSLDDVIVTAQRRSQNLQEVPITVTVFGAQQLQEAKIEQVSEIVTRTPGLSFDAFPSSQPRLAVRGIGSSDKGAAGDASSAVFLDEIYLGRPAAVAFDAFDIARIEVLKGPQGTLFGRNVVGGAVNVITQRPQIGVFDAAAEVSAGNYSQLDGAGFVNAPLGDTTALRVSGAWRTHDGYVRSQTTGGRLEDQDTQSARIQLLSQPNDRLELHLTVDGTRDRGNGTAQHVVDVDPTSSNASRWTINRDRDYNASSINGVQNRDTWGVRAAADYDLPFATLSVLASYRDVDYEQFYDFDGGTFPSNLINLAGGDSEQTGFSSQEVRLSSLPGSKATWVAGLYRYYADTDRSTSLDLTIGTALRHEVFDQNARTESLAAFGDISWPLTERLSVFGGLRYSTDDKTYHITNTRSTVPIRSSGFFDVNAQQDWDATTWRIGANYKITPNHMIYGDISRGYKSGGFQDTPSSAADAATPFNPEYATQYEIGQKSRFLDGRATWNNTLYWMDYTDLQTSQLIGLVSRVTNAGQATIKGYETALSLSPGGGFELDAAYAFTDAKFDVFFEGADDLSGNRISRTPRHKVVLSPSYRHDLASGAYVKFAVDYRYESFIYDDNSNNNLEVREPTEFVDARVIFNSPDDRWALTLWGKNLTDELTRTHQTTFLGGTFAGYNAPTTYGVTLRWNH